MADDRSNGRADAEAARARAERLKAEYEQARLEYERLLPRAASTDRWTILATVAVLGSILTSLLSIIISFTSSGDHLHLSRVLSALSGVGVAAVLVAASSIAPLVAWWFARRASRNGEHDD